MALRKKWGEYLGETEISSWRNEKLLIEVLPLVVFPQTARPMKKASDGRNM
jgi:hypothetical protein